MKRLTNKQLRCRHKVVIDWRGFTDERTFGVLECVKCSRKINFYTTLKWWVPANFNTFVSANKSKDVLAHDTILVEPLTKAHA